MAQLPEFKEYEILEPVAANVTEQEETALQYPKRKLGRVSKLEKVVTTLFVIAALAIAVLTVRMTTAISKAEEAVSLIQIENVAQRDVVSKLEQEKNELSRTERVKEAAEKGGLEISDDNIRNVD
ncbi:cell division protein FtsL [Vagococcus coleopterorum]|uniref:Cell division protein FtsL n=1 Tax=Vagococcus coleopterorum TaxID=2714946 RepID=A0A6G8AKG8_9ENTE|nr:cell division protein FtsL [Vagococcus coleopterorum]QIL45584.1 cell division protein FtsL [Vagococcus coleopterorum]